MSTQRLTSLGAGKLLVGMVRKGCRKLISSDVTVPRYCRTMSTGLSNPKVDLNFRDDGTALVTMKSGENRLHPKTIEEWHGILDEIEKNPKCRAMVTTGQDKFFSNGLDQEYVKTFTHHERQLAEYLDMFNRLIVRILLFPVPTVAAINGHVFAGGALLALAHDLRVMREDKGWFCLNEILINIRFHPVMFAVLKEKIPGPAQTQAILFAKRFTAPEALNYGIVNNMTDQSQLVDTAQQLANQVLGKDGISRDMLNLFKKDLYQNVLKAPQITE